MTEKMKPWHRAHGITEKGVELANKLLVKALEIAELARELGVDEQFMKTVLREANFRVFTIRDRDPKWVERYLKENE